jgi:phosphoglucosamine mutase
MRRLFGTDGIRGIANKAPMTPDIVLKLGRAAGLFFESKNKKSRIVIGKDTRISGYMIENALTAGLCSAGADVLLVGPMPTPAIAHITKSFSADAGIVISASHNPYEHNGIKFFDADGFKLSDSDEEEIEKLVFSEPDTSGISGANIGKAFRIGDASGRYIEFAKASSENSSLKGMKIVLDCANGAAYKISPAIFMELGADVIVINDSPNGLNINENCGALHPEGMIEKVKKEGAVCGIALDGDADRVIMCDENGVAVDGDEIMAICALQLKREGRLSKDTVVATQMSNFGFELAMKDAGISVVKADIGDRYVIDRMKKGGFNFGGEQSGHIIFLEHSTTGDGTISALHILSIMKRTGRKLSGLKKCITKLPQVLVNIRVSEKKEIRKISPLYKKICECEAMLKDSGRILVRYSGTENLMRIMVEGKSEKEIGRIAREIAKIAEKEVGAK